MEEQGFFEGKEDRVIPLAYSDRSKTPIEPYLSDQWFVKMEDRYDDKPGFAQSAMDAVTSGKVTFFPERPLLKVLLFRFAHGSINFLPRLSPVLSHIDNVS